MTILKGRLVRETGINYRGRSLVVALEAPDTILIKEKGRREWFPINILTVYECAMKLKARG